MFARIQRIHRSPVYLKRSYATSAYENFRKLRAFPFEMSPEYAQRQMAKWAAVICDGLNASAALSALATFLPFVDYKRPTRFSAAYFPAWVINAEVEVDASVRSSERTSTVIFKNSYIPGGTHVPTLSVAPLWSRSLDYSEPTPFDESLLEQHGQEIQCIPFTTSPFSVLDVPSSLPDNSVNISENLSFAPSSLQTNLFSAYPVLIPLYVAQYTPEDPESSSQPLTLFIQAHSTGGCIMTARSTNIIEQVEDVLRQIKFSETMEFKQNDEVLVLGEADSRVQLEAVDLKPFRGAETLISQWLESPLRSYSNIETLASMGNLDNDDDPRIREMTGDACDELDKVFNLTKEIVMLNRIVETISHRKPGEVIISLTKGAHGLPKIGSADTSSLQDKLLELKEKRHDLKPHWWIEWELSKQSGDLGGKK